MLLLLLDSQNSKNWTNEDVSYCNDMITTISYNSNESNDNDVFLRSKSNLSKTRG